MPLKPSVSPSRVNVKDIKQSIKEKPQVHKKLSKKRSSSSSSSSSSEEEEKRKKKNQTSDSSSDSDQSPD